MIYPCVFDPDLPQAVVTTLRAHPQFLVPASAPRPAKRTVFLRPAQLTIGLAIFPIGTTLAAMSSMYVSDGDFLAPLFGSGILGVALVIGSFPRLPRLGEGSAARAVRLARLYQGRYLGWPDFDQPAWNLLTRAGQATDTVLGSQVHAEGRLDLANDLVLPRYMWEIAQTLHEQTLLRAEQAAATRGVIVTPGLEAVLAPQRVALERSAASTAERVTLLEEYAQHVMRADAALRAHQQLARNDRYRALLAQTGDQSGLAELTSHANALQSALAESVDEAIAAGRTLVLPR